MSDYDHLNNIIAMLQTELARVNEALAYYEHMAGEDKVRITALQAELKETQAGYIRMTDARDEARAALEESSHEQQVIVAANYAERAERAEAMIAELEKERAADLWFDQLKQEVAKSAALRKELADAQTIIRYECAEADVQIARRIEVEAELADWGKKWSDQRDRADTATQALEAANTRITELEVERAEAKATIQSTHKRPDFRDGIPYDEE